MLTLGIIKEIADKRSGETDCLADMLANIGGIIVAIIIILTLIL